VSLAGALTFGRYAFPPNQLGYCGPDDNAALFQYVAERTADQGLVELERRFEGAYPYLCLIAQANGIADPFDEQVVDAYWIGNSLLDGVEPKALHDSMKDRFGARMSVGDMKWLMTKIGAARPHHNFHVFDIYVRTGLMRDDTARVAVSAMDSCRISWGSVIGVEGAELVVERAELVYTSGKLSLTEPSATRVTRQRNGLGFVDDVKPGDIVSIHWSWACDRLTPGGLARLRRATDSCLALANQTI
jgi:hypothetical protein